MADNEAEVAQLLECATEAERLMKVNLLILFFLVHSQNSCLNDILYLLLVRAWQDILT